MIMTGVATEQIIMSYCEVIDDLASAMQSLTFAIFHEYRSI
jgi:hypothetical protein